MAVAEYLLTRRSARIYLIKVFAVVLVLGAVGLGGCSQANRESRPFSVMNMDWTVTAGKPGSIMWSNLIPAG